MMRRAKGTPPTDLLLDGEDLDLLALSINGTNIPRPEETLETTEPTAAPQEGFRLLKGGNLVIAKTSLPAAEDAPFELHTVVKINPKNNLKLSGLFMSGGFFVTQCEAEGFRRITYYLDRPDVLTRFTVRRLLLLSLCPYKRTQYISECTHTDTHVDRGRPII